MRRVYPERGEQKPYGWFWYDGGHASAAHFKWGVWGGWLHISKPVDFKEWFLRLPLAGRILVVGRTKLADER